MIRILFYSTISASLISQLPMLLESGLDKYLKLSWIPLTILLLLLHPLDFFDKKIRFFYIFVFIFFSYLLILDATTTRIYLSGGGDLYNIIISLLIFVDCYIFWKYYASEKTYKNIIIFMNIGCLILGITVYTFFLQFADMDSTTYAYKAKNSLGQILFAGGLMSITGFSLFKNKYVKISLLISIIAIITVIMLLKSRGTIICIFLVLIYYVFQKRSKILRKYIFIGSIIILSFLFVNEDLYNILVVNIIFANRDASSASSLSSGRTDLVMDALNVIDKNWLTGAGEQYLDCMPIAIILQYGILGALLVFIFLAILSYKVIRLQQNNIINVTVFLIYWAFMLNSLFEAYPPFGPGVKCFSLWMLLGFTLSLNKKCNNLVHKAKITVDSFNHSPVNISY